MTVNNEIKKFCFLALIGVIMLSACASDATLFEDVKPSDSNVHFSNQITESETMNILDFEYLYNGGGVGLGDFNNDGLEDVFLSGNMVANALYLNEGDFEFSDISAMAGIQSKNKWSSGIAVVDINNDGWQDIYVCNTTHKDSSLRRNNLYINQGLNEDGFPTFTDEAAKYGLDDDSYSVNAAFFDYDNDQDLDVIIIVNEMGSTQYHSQYRSTGQRAYFQRVDRLYRNDTNDNGSTVFTNVSEQAGILLPGFSLGVNVSDINKDGWKDIYVSNDFLSDDLIYINQQDGTFKESARDLLKHTSHSAMGNDLVDLNNDGYDEIIALDMLPEDNQRQKRLLGPTNYTMYLNNERYGYSYQFVRNTIQLNNGIDANQQPRYSDISMMAGVCATDWSWTPLVADFDHDGFRDLIITNGFPMDVTDRDFIDYKADVFQYASKEIILSQVPSAKVPNYAYKNRDGTSFDDVSKEWGLAKPSYSNGAVYGDLDNDGDLDIIINNIDDSVSIYRNTMKLDVTSSNNYLQIQLLGQAPNIDAIGAQIAVHAGRKLIWYEHSVFRGYLSSQSKKIHIGLGDINQVDSIIVHWPNGQSSMHSNIQVNQLFRIELSNVETMNRASSIAKEEPFLKDEGDFAFTRIEEDYIDYNIQPLLPHKLSQFGPSLTVGDVNGDELEDMYVGGSVFYNGYFVMQGPNGTYSIDTLRSNNSRAEEMGALIFDANSDGKNEIFISSGSYELSVGDSALQDQIFEHINGDWVLNNTALPKYLSNASSVIGCDYDRDGDIDIFVGGRSVSGQYPQPASSYLLENKSSKDKIKFQLSEQSPLFESIGMITDGIWSDYNNDGWVDLLLTAELSELLVFKNGPSGLEKQNIAGLTNKKGFWNSIVGSDLDNDGDIDYVVGNHGQNTFNKISSEMPYRIYVKDFDDNGSVDALPFAFIKDNTGEYREFPFMTRMDFGKQVNSIRKRYPSYKQYSNLDVNDIISKETMSTTAVYEVNYPYTSIMRNDGSGGFQLEKLPKEAQLSPVYGIVVTDVNDDQIQDIILTGNDYGNELVFGRLDALNGLVLIGRDESSFRPTKLSESGFLADEDEKALGLIVWNGTLSVVNGPNQGEIKRHTFANDLKLFEPLPNDFKLEFIANGRSWVSELSYGSSFLTQSSRSVIVPKGAEKLKITNYQGEERVVQLID